ncbi:phospholipid/cholesterol/gamma-HCH transport system substrate-binding protein [Mycolicibacterium iranicum]|uniref:Phospholipid/cholesterol/gamma-HCH transport system substrate-binding protein n=1 Tax=Mycolicibacterium iranicum TaxID=912594 RepID=A0A839Q8N0_MYCIR|nr:MCE family protein [Mycolicibacterium iranicum]MBB2991194.1 phospholipid/cholesterol/gamma-HCH transport system substrate-binding protein [Mycolicibacterium iranicum]
MRIFATAVRPDATAVKVIAFSVSMLLVFAALVTVFGQFRYTSGNTYSAIFADASRVKSGQDVRMAGMAVGTVQSVELRADNTVAVAFDVDPRYRLYESTQAHIRYENLIGDRYLELTFSPGELVELPPGSTIPAQNTRAALDLDALLGGLRPVIKGLDGDKINAISDAVIELLQGNNGALSEMLSSTSAFTQDLAARDQVIGDVISHLNTVLSIVDDKGAQFDASVDTLQKLISVLAAGRDPIAGAIAPLASAETDLTEMLEGSRRPVQGVIENVRPLAQRLDERKDDINKVIEPLAENYLRLNSLGAYGAFFNIYFCSTRIKINGPAGSDILIPFGGPPDPSKGRCSENG